MSIFEKNIYNNSIPDDAILSIKKARYLDDELKNILNIHTFNQNIWKDKDIRKKILNSFDNKFHITEKPLKLFHGGEISFEKMIFNKPINYDYLATSYVEFVAMKFGNYCPGQKWFMEINVPIGTPIICLDEFSHRTQFEHEILLDPRAKLTIKEINYNYNLPSNISESVDSIIRVTCDYEKINDKNIKLFNGCYFIN